MSAYASIEALRSQLGAPSVSAADAAYAAKMLHPIPQADTVDRSAFILGRTTGQRVLEFGASGPMHDAVVKVAASVAGVDRQDGPGVTGFDLDDVARQALPVVERPDVILCGEVIEHLSNPGWFLTRLRRQYPGVPVLITVPNAFTAAARAHLARGYENVNLDHTCWFSPTTLRVLLARAGYGIAEFHFYGGTGPTAQGLVVVTE